MELEQALEKISELTSELAVKEAKLKDVTDNFAGYRKTADAEKEELTKQLEATTQDYDTFKGDIEKKTAEQLKTAREAKLKELSKGDEKVTAQIEEKYALLNMPEGTAEEVAARLEMARTLAVGSGTVPSAGDAAADFGGLGGETTTDDKISPAAEAAHAHLFGKK
jgi:myosin heavy subunit